MKKASFAKSERTEKDIKESLAIRPRKAAEKVLIGLDVFIDWKESNRDPNVIGDALRQVDAEGLKMQLITNRGVRVYPGGMKETFCSDHWRVRFFNADESAITHDQLIDVLQQVKALGFDFIKTENLYTFDGVRDFLWRRENNSFHSPNACMSYLTCMRHFSVILETSLPDRCKAGESRRTEGSPIAIREGPSRFNRAVKKP